MSNRVGDELPVAVLFMRGSFFGGRHPDKIREEYWEQFAKSDQYVSLLKA